MSTAKHTLISISLLLVLLLLIFGLRTFSAAGFLGESTFSTIRFAEAIREQGIISYDNLSYGGRAFTEELGTPLLLTPHPHLLATILPFLLGLATLFLFTLILNKTAPHLTLSASLLLILNPSFLFLFSSMTKHAVVITLLLLSFYLYLHKKILSSLLTLLFLPAFSIAGTLFTLVLALFLLRTKKITKIFFFTLSIINITLLLILYPYLTTTFPELPRFTTASFGIAFLQHNFLSEFGAAFGLSSFILILSILGIYAQWNKHYTYLLILLFILPLILAAVAAFPFLLLYLSFFLALLSAHGLHWLSHRAWRNTILRNMTLLILSCGIIFSPLAYLSNIQQLQPTPATTEAITYLQSLSGEDVALSSPNNGVFLAYAGKRNVMDTSYLYAPHLNERWDDLQRLYHTTSVEEAITILKKYDVTYIYLDKKMKQETWPTEESELLFLLKYSPKLFGKIYQNSEVEIYLVY